MPHGLSEEQISQIREKIADFPEVDEALLFGSRAKGTQKEGSDIDLVLVGSISHKKLLSLKSSLNDLHTPYLFDVIIYSKIKKEALKKHIDRVGVSIYSKKSAEKSN